MKSLRVLVLDAQLSSRKYLVEALGALGALAIYQAGHCDRAMAILRQAEGVDVIVCELSGETLVHFDFLLAVANARLASAVVLRAELQPQLLRALERINLSAKISLIGVISPDAPSQWLGLIIDHYLRRRIQMSMPAQPAFSLPTEYEVRQGLEAGQFKAWFQPKFSLPHLGLCGVEALVRWEHPRRGVLLPREFLSAVLAYDLIDDMFRQVFVQSLDLLKLLGPRAEQLEVAFNLHASQLSGFDLPSYVEKALRLRQLPGGAVRFEVSQNGLLDINLATLNGLLRLQKIGCGLSIDDFGVGFSSLNLLCHLPFNQLKLDASVVRDLSDQNSQAMLASSLALSRALQMSLVIEGVSSQAILDTVIAMGGTLAQGFHLAKPMTAKRLQQWLVGATQQA
ncbi:EAL domain-containing response regulator [Pseudomonas fluorescens]|uniref:EAL domain-containing response regulator n=1 Tax=Pseudomonas fluorescens TaxID=294 RepID=UPI001905595A|nr:EAL domain-containing response regulator [Pseudomonas fluorescens]MBD8092555.1 EAL domain-containing response regulator [Pseudomonas fluorescens]MBD8718523.1 EAL domain-containing response regulator [Pseudomonas fluorescens]